MAQLTNSVHLNKNIIYSLPSNSPNNLNITNIKLYMEYLELYLRNNIFINKEKFTITVKQLEATPTGIPLEINCFTYKTNSYEYDILQNEIFDYAIAIIPEFNLKIYQQT
jgi:miniconductance mechanosensitive channel